MYDSATPYIAAFVILRRGKTVAFVLREHTAWMNGYYGLLSGKVEKNESYIQAAIREAFEEGGIKISSKDLQYVHTSHRKSEGDNNTWVDVYFEASSWEGEPYNAQSDQHSELKWLDMDKLPANIIPPVEHALKAIEKGEVYSEYGWDT